MRFLVTVRKLNVTDRQTDRRTDRRTDRQTDGRTGGRCNISRPGPSAPREIIKYIFERGKWIRAAWLIMYVCMGKLRYFLAQKWHIYTVFDVITAHALISAPPPYEKINKIIYFLLLLNLTLELGLGIGLTLTLWLDF